MYGMSINTQQKQKVDNAAGSPRAMSGSPRHFGSPRGKGSPSPKMVEVGEIDTRAPFQSVKAAVSLFGEAGASPRSPAAFAVRKNKYAEEVYI